VRPFLVALPRVGIGTEEYVKRKRVMKRKTNAVEQYFMTFMRNY
jgi:hypothetical protein